MGYYQKIKEVGLWRALKIAFTKYLDIDILKLHYLRLNVNYQQIQDILKDFDLEVKDLFYEDFLKGDKSNFNNSKLALVESRLHDKNYKSWGIIENDILIYSTWVSMDNMGLPYYHRRIPMLPNEGLLEDSYCNFHARGRGLHGKMNYYRIGKLYESNRNRIIAIVHDKNVPALKVQKKCGFEDLGMFYCGKVFGIPFCTLNKKKYDRK